MINTRTELKYREIEIQNTPKKEDHLKNITRNTKRTSPEMPREHHKHTKCYIHISCIRNRNVQPIITYTNNPL